MTIDHTRKMKRHQIRNHDDIQREIIILYKQYGVTNPNAQCLDLNMDNTTITSKRMFAWYDVTPTHVVGAQDVGVAVHVIILCFGERNIRSIHAITSIVKRT